MTTRRDGIGSTPEQEVLAVGRRVLERIRTETDAECSWFCLPSEEQWLPTSDGCTGRRLPGSRGSGPANMEVEWLDPKSDEQLTFILVGRLNDHPTAALQDGRCGPARGARTAFSPDRRVTYPRRRAYPTTGHKGTCWPGARPLFYNRRDFHKPTVDT